jgi:DNA-binding MarR family transcriptional regulator
MVRKSNYSKVELLTAVGQRVQAFQDATDELDEAVARRLQLNRTDLRCLSVLSQAGAMSASALADAAGLTRGA